jgi:hypothetical protein
MVATDNEQGNEQVNDPNDPVCFFSFKFIMGARTHRL